MQDRISIILRDITTLALDATVNAANIFCLTSKFKK